MEKPDLAEHKEHPRIEWPDPHSFDESIPENMIRSEGAGDHYETSPELGEGEAVNPGFHLSVRTRQIEEVRHPPYSVQERDGRLYVVPGTTALAEEDEKVLRPVISEIAGEPLDAVPPPSLPIGSGRQELWIDFDEEESSLVLVQAGNDPPDEGCVQILLAEWTGSGRRVSDFIQHRTGHIELIQGDSCSSSSSNSSSESSDSSSESEESDSSSESEEDESDSEGGSDKSTAIVPSSWNEAYTALFIAEMPTVRFDDIVDLKLPKFAPRRFFASVDPKFLEVCEEGTIEVVGYSSDHVGGVGFQVREGKIHVKLPWFNRPRKIVIRLSGIRKGFAHLRFPDRTREQFLANEKFINSAYPANECGAEEREKGNG